MTSFAFTRLFALGLLVLAGCSPSQQGQNQSPILVASPATTQAATQAGGSQTLGPALNNQITKIWGEPTVGSNHAQMRQLLKDPKRAKMVLRMPSRKLAVTLLEANLRDGVRLWRGTDNAQILTKEGIIIGTRGFGSDLISTDTGDLAQILARGQSGQISRIHRLLDGNNKIMIAAWICDLTPAGHENLRLGPDVRVSALRIEEDCTGPRGDFINQWWVVNGQVVQAWQYAGPPPELGPGQMRLMFLP